MVTIKLIKQQEYNEKGIPRGNGFISQSLTRALSFPLGFKHQMYNAPTDKLYEEISTQLFHLWGAKDINRALKKTIKNCLKSGID